MFCFIFLRTSLFFFLFFPMAHKISLLKGQSVFLFLITANACTLSLSDRMCPYIFFSMGLTNYVEQEFKTIPSLLQLKESLSWSERSNNSREMGNYMLNVKGSNFEKRKSSSSRSKLSWTTVTLTVKYLTCLSTSVCFQPICST